MRNGIEIRRFRDIDSAIAENPQLIDPDIVHDDE
jgi:hypothetical protein